MLILVLSAIPDDDDDSSSIESSTSLRDVDRELQLMIEHDDEENEFEKEGLEEKDIALQMDLSILPPDVHGDPQIQGVYEEFYETYDYEIEV